MISTEMLSLEINELLAVSYGKICGLIYDEAISIETAEKEFTLLRSKLLQLISK